MKAKLSWTILTIVFLLLAVLIAGSFFFSDLLLGRETTGIAEGQTRMQETYREMGIADNFVLPAGEDVAIKNGDINLTGSYFENDLDGKCAVLLLHGYTGTRYNVMQYAPLFWDRGCDLFAYDARGHGTSTDAFHTYGYFEKEDARVAYDWLLDRSGLAPDQVGVTGVSYGAATALQMLPLRPDVAFVLADSSYEDFRSIVSYQAEQQFGVWTNAFIPTTFLISQLQAHFNLDEVSPKAAVAGAKAPILLVHSAADEFTPAFHSQEIYANSNHATTELVINDWGSPHAGDIVKDYEAYKAIVDHFLAEYVPDFGLPVSD
jgi:esterase/lipase